MLPRRAKGRCAFGLSCGAKRCTVNGKDFRGIHADGRDSEGRIDLGFGRVRRLGEILVHGVDLQAVTAPTLPSPAGRGRVESPMAPDRASRGNIGLQKVISLEQQRHAFRFRQSVGATIRKVQSSGTFMPSHDDTALVPIHRTDKSIAGRLYDFAELVQFRLSKQNGDNRRGVDDQSNTPHSLYPIMSSGLRVSKSGNLANSSAIARNSSLSRRGGFSTPLTGFSRR